MHLSQLYFHLFICLCTRGIAAVCSPKVDSSGERCEICLDCRAEPSSEECARASCWVERNCDKKEASSSKSITSSLEICGTKKPRESAEFCESHDLWEFKTELCVEWKDSQTCPCVFLRVALPGFLWNTWGWKTDCFYICPPGGGNRMKLLATVTIGLAGLALFPQLIPQALRSIPQIVPVVLNR